MPKQFQGPDHVVKTWIIYHWYVTTQDKERVEKKQAMTNYYWVLHVIKLE